MYLLIKSKGNKIFQVPPDFWQIFKSGMLFKEKNYFLRFLIFKGPKKGLK